ncbi:MAG TPA: MBL fold metallo-hydrolase, partial [Gemmatimonadaceae bacterium]|nr:MBL fold metallo-hydrolase [Gemmatimonadaceae bacterium]
MKLTFLGTGTSFGIPQLGCGCAVCRSTDPRDRRSRVGAAVETDAGAIILIDTPPELRLQLLETGITRVDAVLFTHLHADHTHGIDDLRAITARRDVHLPMYGSAETLDGLQQKFDYIFDDRIQPLPGTSKPQGRLIPIAPGLPVRIADVEVTAVPVPHGNAIVYAYRIGPLAYVTDAQSMPDAAIAALRGARVLVINALFRVPHPSH